MSSHVLGATLFGSKAHLIRVQARLGRGLSRVILVGMPDAVAREARERLPAAFQEHRLKFPKGKVLLNMVPAQMPKCGLPLDLALAIALLVEDRQAKAPRRPILFLAELDLKGRLGPPARGTLLAGLAAIQHGCCDLITSVDSAQEASMAPGIRAFGLADLGEVVRFLEDPSSFCPMATGRKSICSENGAGKDSPPEGGRHLPRLDDLRGQEHARHAAVLAIVGRHSLWMQGPPGTGKSMLARRMCGLLPELSAQGALEVAQVEALLRPLSELSLRPPFRAPHTSASAQALLGGGTPLRPGELARAHGGILFLDEIPEFARPVLEGLRQPLEEREVRLQRAREWATYPADVQLVATSNPCPCGYATHPKMVCRCTPHRLAAYRHRVSGPLRDRFDLFVEMGPVPGEALDGPATPPHDEEVCRQLVRTRAFQAYSEEGRGFLQSGDASLEQIQAAGVAPEARRLLRQAVGMLPLSGRGLLRCLRVARSAGDLEGSELILGRHVHQALSYRPLPEDQEATTRQPRFPPRPRSPLEP
jgi:magnesium chelatase family protein